MSLSVKESRLVAVNRVGENTLQTVLQGKVDLPSTAAPVERVVWVKGTPVLESFATDQDRVYVQGAIDLTMVYVPETLEDEPAGLKRVEWPGALPFDTYVEVIGAEPEMISWVDLGILACEWDLSSGQYSLDLDLIVAVSARVEQVQTIRAICDANISQPVKLSCDGLVLNTLAPAVLLPVDKELTGMLDLAQEGAPPVRTVLEITAQLQLEETQVSAGKLGAKGGASLEVLYEDEELGVKMQNFPQALQFELSFGDPKIQEGMAVQPKLRAFCQGYVVNDGKNIRVELSLKGALSLKGDQTLQVLTEISAPGHQVEVRKELAAVDSFVSRKEQQVTVGGLVELSQQLPPIRELLQSRAEAHLTDFEVENDKLVVEGVLDLELLYLAHSDEDTKPLFRGVFPEVIPFEQTLVIPGLELGMQPRIEVEVVSVRPDLINRETLETAVTLQFAVDVVEYLEVEVAVEAVQVEPREEDPPTLTYLFVQEGDTIWKLSKQYHTTEDAILAANPSLQDDPLVLRAGDRLYIPRT
ncbi:MAG: DUF3794 domain-containing protein [Bacillota bacterium]|jgi:LysM repeat protein|nr:DUF3794 domain-containing protein [Bacillota bacterium]HHT89852.1 DUF3794 domain-containing protein [Bacillota bacterium]